VVLAGIVGIAVKPAVGMFDFASRATEGIKNYARNDFLNQVRTQATSRDTNAQLPKYVTIGLQSQDSFDTESSPIPRFFK
jgi:hypothetical protein